MKKHLGTLTLLGLCAGGAHAQSSVSIYGLLDTGISYTNRVQSGTSATPGSLWTVIPGNMQASRMGFRGTEDLGSGLKAIFILESGLNVDTGSYAQGGIPFGRKSVVGIEGAYGTLLAGRQTDFLDDMGTLSSTIDFGSQVAVIHGLDRTYAERTNNSVRYNSPRAKGFMGSVLLGLGENAGSLSTGQALSLGADYTQGDVRLAFGYYQSKMGTGVTGTAADAGAANIGAQLPAANVKGAPGDVALRTMTFGGAYQWGPARIHGTISATRQPLAAAGGPRTLRGSSSQRIDVYDLGVSYAVTPLLYLSTSVIRDKVSFVNAGSGSLTQFNLGLDYYLSKRTDVYFNVGYLTASGMDSPGMGQGAPGADRSQRIAFAGIRHKF